MAEFFDLGDECNDPYESVGSYDCSDDFIDDGPLSGESNIFVGGGHQGVSGSGGESSSSAVAPSTPYSWPPTPGQGTIFDSDAAVAAPVPDRRESPTSYPDCVREPARRLGKNGKKSGAFRCNSRRLLLTIPKAGIAYSHQSLVQCLEDLGAKYRLGRELHKDGTPHYHCYVDFGRNYQFEGCHRFCFGESGNSSRGTCQGRGHVNILVVFKTPWFVWDYPGKDGPESILADTTDGRPIPSAAKETRLAEGRYCRDAKTRSEFYSRVQEVDPWTFFKCHGNIISCGRYLYPDEAPTKQEPIPGLVFRWESFPIVTQWILASLPDGQDRIRRLSPTFDADAESRAREGIPPQLAGGRPKSLILWGESLHGKTDLAVSLGNHIHWMRDFRLKDIEEVGVDNIDYIIIDDIDWDSTLLKGSAYKSWLGGQRSFVATDKYIKKLRVTWGKPCIFLCNDDPYLLVSDTCRRFLDKNCFIEEVKEGNYVSRRPDVYI